MTAHYDYFDSPIGTLKLWSDGRSLRAIEFEGQHTDGAGRAAPADAALRRCHQQLAEYFRGERRHFDLPLAAAGTPFQREVWLALRQIPYGQVRSYRELAVTIGRPRAVRAVGAANGRNPLPVVVPCHRVIGSDGSLTGFAGGLALKRSLLELEGVALA